MASDMIQSIEVHAGPNDEAYGASVNNHCPALFLYLSPKLDVHVGKPFESTY